ncbi:MAG: hypothetical protein WKF34_10855 [Pyrinomonadaceae bacterium]
MVETDVDAPSETPKALPGNTHKNLSLRVSAYGYTSALLIATFFSSLLLYLELDLIAFVLLLISWIVLPFLAFRDEITFDGRRLVRGGFLPRWWASLNGVRYWLRISDIEAVETHAVRTVRRGGDIYYRYKTVLRGKGVALTITSGGDDFRRMINGILTRLPENVLDTRSIELRDFLTDPRRAVSRAEASRIPSADALEGLFRTSATRGKKASLSVPLVEPATEKVNDLRSLANELKVSGHVIRALEAFRRALVVRPGDAWLLFEFARCLHSFADIERDDKLERRSLAALRLSEQRAGDDGDLLVRLGEWYSQIGEWRRADNVFRIAVERMGENFRLARGLAELALHDGKIAHVIHHFAAAGRMAETPSLRRWSKNETEYFANLNSDNEYMQLEVSRVSMLDTAERSKKTALRIALAGLTPILLGVVVGDFFVANVGWTITTVALVVWSALIVMSRMLVQRIPYNLIETDD